MSQASVRRGRIAWPMVRPSAITTLARNSASSVEIPEATASSLAFRTRTSARQRWRVPASAFAFDPTSASCGIGTSSCTRRVRAAGGHEEPDHNQLPLDGLRTAVGAGLAAPPGAVVAVRGQRGHLLFCAPRRSGTGRPVPHERPLDLRPAALHRNRGSLGVPTCGHHRGSLWGRAIVAAGSGSLPAARMCRSRSSFSPPAPARGRAVREMRGAEQGARRWRLVLLEHPADDALPRTAIQTTFPAGSGGGVHWHRAERSVVALLGWPFSPRTAAQ